MEAQLLKSAHDCSDGGLAVAVAESGFSSLNRSAIGAEIVLNQTSLDAATLLFSESPSRIVITFSPENVDSVREMLGDCPFEVIGKVGGEQLKFSVNGETVVSAAIDAVENAWRFSLDNQLEN
jgi:phosphoribosylformylglycinamidine synthase